MTSVLYGSGLNYQVGNPVRSEIRQIERKVNDVISSMEDFKKGFSGVGAASAATPSVSSTEFETRFQKLSEDIQAVQGALGGLGGRIDRGEVAAADYGTRISRIESAQLGSSSMVMEQRSIIDRLVTRIEKLEAAAAAAAAVATTTPTTVSETA